MATLSLDEVIDVKISAGPLAKVRTNFTLGLIVGKSSRISINDRVKVYSSTEGMKLDKFVETDPEYQAAVLYFSQSPTPNRIAIGVVGENESIVQGVTACRKANSEWYEVALAIEDITDEDILAVASYIESCTPSSIFKNTLSGEIVTTPEGIITKLKNANYKRTFSQYSSTTKYAVVSAMGYAMANANTYFTAKFKAEPGVTVEDLDDDQYLFLRNNNVNYFASYGEVYSFLAEGVMADGTFYDEVINLDMLKNDIQVAMMNEYVSTPCVPGTDDGVQMSTSGLINVLDSYVKKQFIAPGVWKGKSILGINAGDVLPKGYLIINDSVDEQSQADREARKAPNTYILIKQSGAFHSMSIGVYSNR